jgi:hypothetical protein
VDTLVHGVLGAALCSRTGIPGGRRGPVDAKGHPKGMEWTFWAAFLFGLLPDLTSLGLYILPTVWNGSRPVVGGIPDWIFFLYSVTHSLLGMGVILGVLILLYRPLWLPALAWPLHVGMDVFTHGDGVFLTPILWPFSECHFVGWSWWLHPSIFYGSWMLAAGLWMVVGVMRISGWRERKSNELS